MRTWLILAAATLSLACAPARADPTVAAAPTAVSPVEVPYPAPLVGAHWIRRPSGQDMADYYPLHAAQRGLSGRAVLICTVTKDGRLTDCTATNVSPPGENFEQASLKLAPRFQVDVTPKGDPTLIGKVVSIPIGWRAPNKG